MAKNVAGSLVPDNLGLVHIAAGTQEVRDAREGTTRSVLLRPFELGRTPVTEKVWHAVLGSAQTPSRAPAHPVTWFDAVRWCNTASSCAGLKLAYQIDGRDVDWDVAADGYRLPTEAEWEWAARAGSLSPTYGALAEIAWTAADQVDGAQEVALKAPNNFGLFDTIGNVWEWCWDYADTARYGDYRSLRGGGWADPQWSARASVRRGSAPDAVLEDVGFRVARGAAGDAGTRAAQGWSAEADRVRADIRGPRPIGWTPLRSLLTDRD
ncbi:SUMF1/EgtB/PvdO family nonheme iron enzyme [Arthrobacter sp. GMC3]|uniref:formylglycine-generating enzyme family protein n=1 Tax=Arthrobacter sp. GMC3 TaxID=2058894 RepID=UPI000CE41B08|nr:SUMF1/EgtB/PvdO family nonheme iron enzyme [Arthrobacter sp. GMC3]